MCGIAVAIGWDGAEAAVAKMIGGILHRGDVSDPIVTPFPNAAMGTRRLRIVDADHAVQPQASFDGRILVSFNGEIYNHNELRHELEQMGVRFRTHSDTEVIASALLAWGAAALQRFIGMFAFVAVDTANGEFLAVRDPMGVKPLYFIKSASGYLFCSEIKSLLDTAETGDVMLLPAGCMLSNTVYGAYQSRLQVQPSFPRAGDNKTFDTILEEAVRIRLPPDLPVASLFSGGIDSTLVTHYARKFDDKIPGYFLGDSSAPDYEFAARYADLSGLDFRLTSFEPATDEIFAMMPAVIECVESFEPEVIRSSLCSYLLSRRIHQDGFRVALCGEGADELFCGYLPLELVFAEGNEIGNPVRAQCLSHMSRTNLQRVDRCSMQFQLETRVPFMDPAIIMYALGLDASAMVHEIDGMPRGKMPLRQLYDLYPDRLPPEIRDRSKVPFNEGAGLDTSQTVSPWLNRSENMISDADLADGQKRYPDHFIKTKEELMYLDLLAASMDVSRVPHLKARTHLSFPEIKRMDLIREFIVAPKQNTTQ